MPALPSHLLQLLGDLVVDMREGYEAGAWAVPDALSKHTAFTETGGPASSLTRAIVASEFKKSAARLGLQLRTATGGAVELAEFVETSLVAVIRLRHAEEVRDELRVISNSGSTWGGITEDGFFREYPYVFGWMTTTEGSLDFFVAEVTGVGEGNPPFYEFGWMHHFNGPKAPSGESFKPADDDSLGDWDAGSTDLSVQA